MLVKNDAKGSFGAFSNLGRTTVNTFINIKNKDLILHPEKYRNNKDSIINFLKRNKYNNIEGDESKEQIKDDQNFEEESEIEEPIEEHDIFDINEEEEKNKKNKEKNKNINLNNFFHKTNIEAYKYHDMNMQKKRIKKKFYTPNCTKYVPKKDYVWNRIPTCLKWDTMQKRKPLHLNLVDANLMEHDDPLKNIQNCFVNMDKQTMRGDSIKFNNVRIQTAKPFNIGKNIKRKKHKNKKRIKTGTLRYTNKRLSLDNHYMNDINNNNIFDLNKNKNNRHITTEMTDDTNKNNNNNLNLNINITTNNKSKSAFEEEKNNYLDIDITKKEEYMDESLLDDSYHKFKSHYAKQLKINNLKTEINEYKEKNVPETKINNYPIIKTEINDSKIINNENKRPKTALIDKKNIENKNKIKGPVFDKIIPREYYDNLNDNGIKLIPFAVNNYNQVRERPVTMVKYNTKKSFKKKLDFFKGIEVGQYLNTPINYIEHKNYVPIFKKMHTRPDDTNPLPIYMKGVVSRNACNMTSNVSLKMNSYADGKTRGNYNTCNPKKSFNKIVNLNLMNYQELKKYILMNKDLLLGVDDNYIIKSLRFYNRNYRELLKETATNFDNITFKTIKSKYEYNLNM